MVVWAQQHEALGRRHVWLLHHEWRYGHSSGTRRIHVRSGNQGRPLVFHLTGARRPTPRRCRICWMIGNSTDLERASLASALSGWKQTAASATDLGDTTCAGAASAAPSHSPRASTLAGWSAGEPMASATKLGAWSVDSSSAGVSPQRYEKSVANDLAMLEITAIMQ
jgi:hypothetical protein